MTLRDMQHDLEVDRLRWRKCRDDVQAIRDEMAALHQRYLDALRRRDASHRVYQDNKELYGIARAFQVTDHQQLLMLQKLRGGGK